MELRRRLKLNRENSVLTIHEKKDTGKTYETLHPIKPNGRKKTWDVKVHCHGGCTIKCMYTHLAPVVKLKPEFILLHVGTNDCSNKTSDEVMNELTEYVTEYCQPQKSSYPYQR